MKKIVATLLLLPSLALAAPNGDTRTVSLTGYGEVSVKPDTAVLNLHITVSKEKAMAAKKAIDERIDDFLDASDISKSDVVISNISSHPQYGYEQPDRGNYNDYNRREPRRVINNYTASRTLKVTVRDLDRLAEVMEAALEENIDGIEQVYYTSSKAEQHRKEARKLAIAHAKQQAKELADAFEADLGEIHSINYNRSYAPRGRSAEGQRVHHGGHHGNELIFSDSINVSFSLQ